VRLVRDRTGTAQTPQYSYIRFAAELPNQRWQADFTHWRLADGTDTEILCWLDDHSRYALSVTAHHRVTGSIVLDTFRKAIASLGIPASTLTDNGMVFTTRLSGGKGGRNAFEAELHRLGITQINSTPNHPTTCGKVERFHQALKRWLSHQPHAATTTELHTHLDAFVDEYNHRRPHRSLPQQATPATTYTARPKASPGDRTDSHYRDRTDRVDDTGSLTLRHAGRLHHIGIRRAHARTHVLMLVRDLDVTVLNAATGEVIGELTIDPTRDYQPRNVPTGRPRKKPSTHKRGLRAIPMSCDITGSR
jgi:transposase InsO family protein